MDIPRQKGSAHAEESPVFFDSSGKFISQEECKEVLFPTCDLTSAPIESDGSSTGVTVSERGDSISSIVTSCDDSGVSCDESSRCVTPLTLVSDTSSRSLLSCETSSGSITPSVQSCKLVVSPNLRLSLHNICYLGQAPLNVFVSTLYRS